MGNIRAFITSALLTAITLVLAGCATAPDFSSTAPAAAGKGVVYAYRAKILRDTINGPIYNLLMDGQKVGKFRKHTYLPISVSPGKHKFEYRIAGNYGMPGMAGGLNGILDDQFLEVDVQEGKTYYLLFGNPNFWLKLVDEREALEQLRECQLAEAK